MSTQDKKNEKIISAFNLKLLHVKLDSLCKNRKLTVPLNGEMNKAMVFHVAVRLQKLLCETYKTRVVKIRLWFYSIDVQSRPCWGYSMWATFSQFLSQYDILREEWQCHWTTAIGLLKQMLWMNELSRELSLRWVSDGYFSLHDSTDSNIALLIFIFAYLIFPQITRFMGPTWGPPGNDRTQVGPMLAPWALLSGSSYNLHIYSRIYIPYTLAQMIKM